MGLLWCVSSSGVLTLSIRLRFLPRLEILRVGLCVEDAGGLVAEAVVLAEAGAATAVFAISPDLAVLAETIVECNDCLGSAIFFLADGCFI